MHLSSMPRDRLQLASFFERIRRKVIRIIAALTKKSQRNLATGLVMQLPVLSYGNHYATAISKKNIDLIMNNVKGSVIAD